MTSEHYGGKRYNEMTSQERYDHLVKEGTDPHGEGRAFCHDCGFFPAFVPSVCVANRVTVEVDKYLLQLPHLCDKRGKKRGLTNHGYLIPKTEEFQTPTQSCEAFMKEHPAWVKKLQDKGIKDLMDQGMTEEDAKGMLGVQ
jgi:hypothetical protein